MNAKFHVLVLMSCFLLDEFVQSHLVFSNCYPDTPQKCSRRSAKLEWPETKIKYLLFTRQNPEEPERLHLCNGTLPNDSHYNPNNELIIFIPGFMFGTCEIWDITEIKDELLKKGDFNVMLLVDSEEYGNEFLGAMVNVEKAANTTVRVLRNIQDKAGINSKVHLIGHSLGAHVAGLIGRQFPIHRITGLDPAGVTYTKDTHISKRLDPSDAELVDTIHTNGGTGLPYLGAYFPMGDADFYVNGGFDQPQCGTSAWLSPRLLNFNVWYVIGTSSVPTVCSHATAIQYYKLSINNANGKYIAYACPSYKKFKSGNCSGKGELVAIMGHDFEKSFTTEHKSRKFPRKYYIDTEV